MRKVKYPAYVHVFDKCLGCSSCHVPVSFACQQYGMFERAFVAFQANSFSGKRISVKSIVTCNAVNVVCESRIKTVKSCDKANEQSRPGERFSFGKFFRNA